MKDPRQTKQFKMYSTSSNQFIGYYNVFSELNDKDYGLIEDHFEDAFNNGRITLVAKAVLTKEQKEQSII